MEIDRIDLADVGNNPAKLARAVVEQSGYTDKAIPVREIAAAIDIIEITEKPGISFEGALVTDPEKSLGQIFVRQDRDERRKRFTISHEIGHYLMEHHRPLKGVRFECDKRGMVASKAKPNDRGMRMEVEANQFAAELLMPRPHVTEFLRRKAGVDLGHILDMSDRFDVSKEAAARRYVSFAKEPVAVVFSEDGKVRYVEKSDEFPALDVWNGDNLPAQSLTVATPATRGSISNFEEVDRGVWLRSGYRRGVVCEQLMPQSSGFAMTLLALEDDALDDDEEEWDAPRFRR